MEVIFEKGIPGFENLKKFSICTLEENPKFKLINSIEDENIGFVAITPFDIKNDYEIDLNEETIKELDIKSPKDTLVLSLITLGKTLNKSTVNLKAPIIINIKNNKGKQIILQDDNYDIKYPLTGSEENASNY
ncbi:flagellar assembly protein FliW [Romboutsia maritimum]|uniref:Flagellar assembly factor FliW n=1 Tax=Romboutsia maritimum TaxID=2020948 RepID=A0A371IVJ2_9FIRM|nr:flagellar assembly protein FliW [Romboutsia maritimum]RDY24502.1 flagellar assembly protein FliW [Romboutsia maritimum]